MLKTPKTAKPNKLSIPTYQPIDEVEPQGEIESQKKPESKGKPEIVGKERKPIRMTANQVAYEALRRTGLNHYQTTKQLGLSKGYGYDTNGPAKKSYITMLESLASPAIKSLKNLSRGQLVGEMESIKGSDVISACKEVLDRVVPKQQAVDAPTNTFIQINHNLFAPAEIIPTAIDVTT